MRLRRKAVGKILAVVVPVVMILVLVIGTSGTIRDWRNHQAAAAQTAALASMFASLQVGDWVDPTDPLVKQFTADLNKLVGVCGIVPLQASADVVRVYVVLHRGGDTYSDVFAAYLKLLGRSQHLTPQDCSSDSYAIASMFLTQMANPAARAYCRTHSCVVIYKGS